MVCGQLPPVSASAPDTGFKDTVRRLAVFLEDTKDFTETETIGCGEAVYIHYRLRHGLLGRRRMVRFLAENAVDCAAVQPLPVALPTIRQLHGDAAELVRNAVPRLIPPGTERLAIFPGQGTAEKTLVEIAEKVRFPELIGGAEAAALAAKMEAETGLSVPVFSTLRPEPEKLVLRLPGAPPGCGLDLSAPAACCTFLPPLPLRRVCRTLQADGDVLAGLLSFFGFSPRDAGVFLSNFTKAVPRSENGFI